MEIGGPDLSDEEEMDQILKEAEGGDLVGEWSETGEPTLYNDGQMVFNRKSDGSLCFGVEKHFVDQLLKAGRLNYTEETGANGDRRRIYSVRQ